MIFKGIPINEGIAIGKPLVVKEEKYVISKETVLDVQKELLFFNDALKETVKQYDVLILAAKTKHTNEFVEILEGHQMIAKDPEMIKKVSTLITEKQMNAANAVDEVMNVFIHQMTLIQDDYLKMRMLDFNDVKERLIKNILKIPITDLISNDSKVILVFDDLMPSKLVLIDMKCVLGIVSQKGGKTSHSAILTKTLNIPAVFGVHFDMDLLKDEKLVIIDGHEGLLIIPTEKEIFSYQKKHEEHLVMMKNNHKMRFKNTLTKDKESIALFANISNLSEMNQVDTQGAEGVGLFRTEFLYFNRKSAPSEDEQFEIYKKVLSTINPKPVIIRTFDMGSDKMSNYLELYHEPNPALGVRGIRLGLKHLDLLNVQMRALLRASIYGQLSIMFPMISSRNEILIVKKLLEEIKKAFDDEKIAYADYIKIGVMIEVPIAALQARFLAKEVDFFSIGTNDLIQYVMAADRQNDALDHLYQPLNPGVLKLLKHVYDAALEAKIEVSVCGEMASDLYAAVLLAAIGFRKLSINPAAILKLRYALRNIDLKNIEQSLVKILNFETEDEVIDYIKTYID
jgi:phosphoenolpyruvate-protein phosphotransferase (PTS system enzyme I)